jgi:hypothetical protein
MITGAEKEEYTLFQISEMLELIQFIIANVLCADLRVAHLLQIELAIFITAICKCSLCCLYIILTPAPISVPSLG